MRMKERVKATLASERLKTILGSSADWKKDIIFDRTIIIDYLS